MELFPQKRGPSRPCPLDYFQFLELFPKRGPSHPCPLDHFRFVRLFPRRGPSHPCPLDHFRFVRLFPKRGSSRRRVAEAEDVQQLAKVPAQVLISTVRQKAFPLQVHIEGLQKQRMSSIWLKLKYKLQYPRCITMPFLCRCVSKGSRSRGRPAFG